MSTERIKVPEGIRKRIDRLVKLHAGINFETEDEARRFVEVAILQRGLVELERDAEGAA